MGYTVDSFVWTAEETELRAAYAAGDSDSDDLVIQAFARAGRLGLHRPCAAIGVRIGAVPANGQSRNFRDGGFERGVSLLWDSESGYESDGSFEMFNRGKRVWVSGYVLIGERGSDGEPLMVGAVAIRKPRKLPSDCPSKYR